MKEWGMQAYPRQVARLQLNALNDWGRTGRALGQGVQEFGAGLAELAPVMAQVAQMGQRADAAGMLEEIGRETTEELLELPVRDWDYSWQQAYTPRVQQMLNQFHGEEREQARRLSELYGSRFSMDGRRQLELRRIEKARAQWRKQVDSAAQRGDADAACSWVEQGRNIFVPEAELEQELTHARSIGTRNQWLNQLRQEPYEALLAWQNPESDRPAGEAERQELQAAVDKTRAELFSGLAEQLRAAVEQGLEPDSQELERASAAGVLPPALQELHRRPRQELTTSAACDWLRRIDERDAGTDEQLTVEIALSPISAEQRRILLRRLQETAALPPQQRSGVSRTLWNLYHEGAFGAPGDEQAMQSLGRLQEEALLRMGTRSEKETEQWLESLRQESEAWVCFDNQ